MSPMPNLQSPELREFVHFLKDLSHVLIECGCSSNRVELLCTKIGKLWGFEVEVLAIPTGVWIVARKDGEAFQELTRIRSWRVDLGRLSAINDLVEQLQTQRVSIDEVQKRLTTILSQQHPYPAWVMTLAAAGSSGGLVAYYGGNIAESMMTALLGCIVHILGQMLSQGEHKRYLGDFVSSAVVTLIVLTVNRIHPDLDESLMIVGGIVSLVPGLVFLNAIHEIAQKNLLSGTAKLMDSLVIAASLSFGVVFVRGIMSFLRVAL
jgi:uncharacterized membrane protein YjjP (DUF1212 family)